ncbi:MAG: 3-demethylubiquinone-9 3-methyltransferase [Oceanicaulis sp. HLUCCA04]|nr:MAG: 3-demethylubiquinone-9 3-methyltransferase [Oceanicaulis sp. HLUCCA04]
MTRISACIWSNGWAEDAAELYSSLFPGAEIIDTAYFSKECFEHHGQPEGTVMCIELSLGGQDFMLLNGGPQFTPNPAISFFVFINDRAQIDRLWAALADGGKAMMELGSYPWCEHYGWVEDRFGVSWQLMMADPGELKQTIVPALMFTQGAAGKAEEAMAHYGEALGGFRPVAVDHYPPGTGANEGLLMHGQYTMAGQAFIAFDSPNDHGFGFTPGISVQVHASGQAQTDRIWDALRHVPEAEQCGWLADRYGLSWQVLPDGMSAYTNGPDDKGRARAREAMFAMKKIDIVALKTADEG